MVERRIEDIIKLLMLQRLGQELSSEALKRYNRTVERSGTDPNTMQAAARQSLGGETEAQQHETTSRAESRDSLDSAVSSLGLCCESLESIAYLGSGSIAWDMSKRHTILRRRRIHRLQRLALM